MKLNEVQDRRQSVIADLRQALARAAGADARFLTFEIYQSRDGSPELGVRDFGRWVVPADAEDDGDYDWKEPTKETLNKVYQIRQDVMKKHPGMAVVPYTGEKNWIYWTVRELGDEAQ